MDRIDAPFVLDAAFLLVLLIGSFIGLVRGVRREVFVSVGVLLGYALVDTWTTPWANDLRDLVDMSAGLARFLVTAAFVVVPAVALGVFGPRAAEHSTPDFAGRVGGAVLAIANLTVVVVWLGRSAVEDLLGSDRREDVAQTRIVRRILEEPGLVLLGAAVTGLVLLVGAMSVQGRRRERFSRATPVRPPDARVHRREHPALAPEAEKVEPRSAPGGWAPRPTGRPGDAAATIPIPVVGDSSRNGGSRATGSLSGSDWLSVQSSSQPSEPVARCLTCGERLSESDRFCPRCGRSLG